MKTPVLLEKIGTLIIIVAFIFLILNIVWEVNLFSIDRSSALFFNAVGLVVFGIGRKKRKDKEKSDSNLN